MTTLTDRFYGANANGAGRTVQDMGLCDLKGEYVYTAKLRAKGFLLALFFTVGSDPSLRAIQEVQKWTTQLPQDKWTAIGIVDGDRAELTTYSQKNALNGITILVDNELYQTRMWGVSQVPSVYLISGKTGRILTKVIGDGPDDLENLRQRLLSEVQHLIDAEEAAKQAEEKKKAEEAAKK